MAPEGSITAGAYERPKLGACPGPPWGLAFWLSGGGGGGSKKDAKDFNSVYPPKQLSPQTEGKPSRRKILLSNHGN